LSTLGCSSARGDYAWRGGVSVLVLGVALALSEFSCGLPLAMALIALLASWSRRSTRTLGTWRCSAVGAQGGL
jgi:hypothetical protein